MILKVGLTGGIASGKSTVAGMFARLGCRVVDADQIVRDLYRRGQPGYRALVDRYGDAVLTAEGEIDRIKLSNVALSTPAGAAELNAMIHPLVIERQQQLISKWDEELGAVGGIGVVEATLLLESGGKERFDRIVVVDVDPDTQLARAVSRGLSRDEALLRISRQMDRYERLSRADYVVANQGTLADLERGTEDVFEQLRADLRVLKRA